MRAEQLDPRLVQAPAWLRFRAPQSFADQAFAVLKASIASTAGNVQAIKVLDDSGGKHFEMVYGYRRLQACAELGLPVLALIEEGALQRQSLLELTASNDGVPPFELGCLYNSALAAGIFPSTRRLAEAVGKSLTEVTAALRLARLPAEVLTCFADPRTISMAAAKKLVTLAESDPAGVLKRAEGIRSAGAAGTAHALRSLLLLKPRPGAVLRNFT